MTQDRPHLFLNRLIVVTHTGVIAYDETFHLGVNIIRGVNSSGKSTIANFIFFILGGDFDNWTSEAIKCREVFAEVNINGAVLTLRRYIGEGGSKPMNFFWGPYEESRKNAIEWQTFPYRQTAQTTSFTNILFKALNFPEVKSDTDSNITMHQLLRLIYIDQDTPTQNLFRFERFDLPLTRQTIAEVLLGVYDDTLYTLRLNYRTAQKSQEDKKRQYDHLNRLFSRSGTETNLETIEAEIEQTRNEFNENEEKIVQLRSEQRVRTTNRTATNTELLQQGLSATKGALKIAQQKADQLELDILDSRQFIKTLEKRVYDLNNSLLIRKVLGELPLTHCPQCLSVLDTNHPENTCILCKQPLTEDAEKANAKRLLVEMELQIKESHSLLEEKEKHLLDLQGEITVLQQKGRLEQKDLDAAIANVQSTRDDRIDAMLVRKGELARQLEYLAEQIKIVSVLNLLKSELEELAATIKRLQIDIQEKENKQRSNFEKAMRKIKDYTLQILQADLDRQDEFRNPRNMEIDFLKDVFTLDGGNNFSASSKTYFKNAILFAIFFASVELDYFRYPRFILCDNMEDKGMEKVRTQNFQKVITDISNNLKNPHQIIFTTSMVNDDLNNTPLCVGREYTSTDKSLRMQSAAG
jgi:hypothetical protein